MKKNNNNIYDFTSDPNGKEYFELQVKKELDIDKINSDDIFQQQRRTFKLIDNNSDFYKDILEMLEQIVQTE
ncbi:hypothetical protein MX112_05430 [Streptococcus uberis]|nr:hypothetical protein [Streptococcus uberis]